MAISLLHGCAHIELAVRDLPAARAFLEAALDATPIEQELVRDLSALVPDGYRIEHLDCGRATFQLNQPAPSMTSATSVHERYLDEVGPCVTDLNFYVDDIAHARDLLGRLGAETLMEGPSTLARSLADYGATNTRPGGAARPFLYLGTRPLLGFDLELMEPNFLRFADQTAQRPCFSGRPDDADGLRLLRLTVAVDDLDAMSRNLRDVIAPDSRSDAYDVRKTSSARACRFTVGGIELEYCQPLTDHGALARHLEEYGQGVIACVFGAARVDDVLARLARTSIGVALAPDLLGERTDGARFEIAGRSIVGFDIVIEDVDEQALADAS